MKHHMKICPCYVISGFIAFQHIAFVIENVSAVKAAKKPFLVMIEVLSGVILIVVKKSERFTVLHCDSMSSRKRRELGTLLCLFVFLIRRNHFVDSISYPACTNRLFHCLSEMSKYVFFRNRKKFSVK